MDAIVQAHGLSKFFGKQVALGGVSFDLPRGSICGLLGPNGSGKTTLLRLITQLYLPDAGKIFFDSVPLNPSHKLRIGYLPEERGLYKHLRVGEQLIYFGQLHKLSKAQAKANAQYWCKRLDIMDRWRSKSRTLSKGMGQKIQLIAALMHQPSLLILDEPISGFDVLNQTKIGEQLRHLQSQGTTILLSTHRMDLVENICDYIICIHKSQKVLEGIPAQLKKAHRSGKPTYVVHHENATPLFPPGCEVLEQRSVGTEPESVYESIIALTALDLPTLLEQSAIYNNITYAQERIPSIQELFLDVTQPTP